MGVGEGLRGAVASTREWSENLAIAGRLARDLPRFLRTPLSVDSAARRVRRALERREERFLALVDRAVYANPGSPYRWLLANAGCERGDLHALVGREGLEGALRQLAEVGVYVSFDELKGRRPVVRGSARRSFSDRDFDNPLAPGHYIELTGGSRGRPTRVIRNLGSAMDVAVIFALTLEAFGIRRPRNAFWFGATLTWPLVHLKLGQPIDVWYQPLRPFPLLAEAAIRYVVLLARLSGRRLPVPTYRDPMEPAVVARWLADRAGSGQPIVMNLAASSAVRVAVAAAEQGLSLDGVMFNCRFEPLTTPRLRLIEAAGARAMASYAAAELASIGVACATGLAADDLHFCADRLAVIERERAVVEGGPSVEALLLTTLSPTTPKLCLNTEIGDVARVEQRDCGCLLGELGLMTHLTEVRSFEKLSSEGTTFARTNLLQILEEVLPARFGGSAVAYQLVEEEVDGAMLLVLRVDPAVGPLDEGTVRSVLLAEMGRGGMADEYQARLLDRAASIVVRRQPPIATRAGKVLPFHLARTSAAGDGARS